MRMYYGGYLESKHSGTHTRGFERLIKGSGRQPWGLGDSKEVWETAKVSGRQAKGSGRQDSGAPIGGWQTREHVWRNSGRDHAKKC